MRRIITTVLVLSAMLSLKVYANECNLITKDTYIQLGQYNNEPILWRCIDADGENGKLILSDKILTNKSFDLNDINTNWTSWEGSILRAWLNSDNEDGETEWINLYEKEGGFLKDSNFSQSEKSLIKSISQWNILPSGRVIADAEVADKLCAIDNPANLLTNGVKFPWGMNYSISNGRAWEAVNYNDVLQFSHVEGAMYRLEDTMFILDQRQLYDLWKNDGSILAEQTKILSETQKVPEGIVLNPYWIRCADKNTAGFVADKSHYSVAATDYGFIGVRPAFYLNEDNVKVISGKGTKKEPYIVDGTEQQGAAIFCNGSQVQFDTPPINESDRILIPMRSVFESLGAQVVWNAEKENIQVMDADNKIFLKIGDKTMNVNNSLVTLDVSPKLINDRTYLPLRAISEALGAKVAYIENLNRVVIDKPKLPMDFGEGKGLENWQNGYIEKMEEIHGLDLWKEVYDEEIYPWVSER